MARRSGKEESFAKATREGASRMVVQQARRTVIQEEHNDLLQAWLEHVERTRRGQEANWSLARDLVRESAEAYEDFLDSIFFYYGENARAAERATREG